MCSGWERIVHLGRFLLDIRLAVTFFGYKRSKNVSNIALGALIHWIQWGVLSPSRINVQPNGI
jgi:hypothetical protein